MRNGRPTKKIKCYDGIVREFYTTRLNKFWAEFTSTICCNCGFNWGEHSFNTIKEELKKHTCKIK